MIQEDACKKIKQRRWLSMFLHQQEIVASFQLNPIVFFARKLQRDKTDVLDQRSHPHPHVQEQLSSYGVVLTLHQRRANRMQCLHFIYRRRTNRIIEVVITVSGGSAFKKIFWISNFKYGFYKNIILRLNEDFQNPSIFMQSFVFFTILDLIYPDNNLIQKMFHVIYCLFGVKK